MKLTTYYAAATIAALTASASAASIGINFAENANQAFAGGATFNIGLSSTNSSNWNNTIDRDSGTLASGSMDDLVDDSGTATTADLVWSSSNVWYNSDGINNDSRKLAVGYLDDGGSGVSITVSDIPFSNYVVYGLLASDHGGGDTYTTQDFTVNGTDVLGGTATAYKGVAASWGATQNDWTPLTTSTTGNYWTSPTLTSSSVTIAAPARSGNARGSITGLVIHEVAAIPEPSTTALLGLGGLALILRRRK